MIQKAQHYADLILATQTEDDCKAVLSKVVYDLLLETGELAKARHINTDAGLFGIFHEIDLKWRKIVNICAKRKIILKEDGFFDMVYAVYPDVANAWRLYSKRVRNRSVI